MQRRKLPVSGPAARLAIACLAAAMLNACATATKPSEPTSFAERCAAPGVVRCEGFDDPAFVDRHTYPPWGMDEKRAVVDTVVRASGAGSLRFEIPSNTGADTSGSFWINFADDLSVQFGEGDEFFVQWRQRFSPDFVRTRFSGDGWKQAIIGEGDRPDSKATSCTQLELVVINSYNKGYPVMYHSCGAKDSQYQPLFTARAVRYIPDQWMTFQMRVRIGTWYENDRRYRRDSAVELWVAREGYRSVLAVNQTGYDLANNNPKAAYGKLWFLPYNTRKSPNQAHPVAYTWYDDLIISTERIADP